MKKPLLSLVLLSCLTAFAQDASWLADARKVATTVPPKLLQVLTEEIAKGGPDSAIAMCREKAPQLAKASAEETGWAIRRVSLDPRHPTAVADAG